MKPSRRNFIKLTSAATGALAPAQQSPSPPAAAARSSVVPMMDVPEGSIRLTPSDGTAAVFGTWTVTYHVGKSGVRRNGGIRVQLPDSWHSGVRNSANRLQASDPKDDNYVSSHCSREGIRLRTWVEFEPGPDPLVKNHRPGLDGRLSRYIYVVRVWVINGDLHEGDTISITYGDISLGSRGMRAGIISTLPEPVLVALDLRGDGDFRIHPDRPSLKLNAGPAAELFLHGPATLVQGKPAELLLSVVDQHQNPATSFSSDIELHLVEGHVDVPPAVAFHSQRGWERVKIVPHAPGVVRVSASVSGNPSLTAAANPMKIFDSEPELKVYWGDLHSHTHYSWDGVGHGNFEYARNTTGLDFYAMTDHSDPAAGAFAEGLGPTVPEVWSEYNALTDRHYQPGQFVTLHAYECSFEAPYGHHNVYFRDKPGPLFAEGDVSLPGLWSALKAGEALTIPHHTGKMPFPIFWYPHNSELDRNIEIYSAHGLSEAYDPAHPLSFENSTFTDPSKSVKGPQYVQDAWTQGLQLSTIASSDDHRAHPGQPQFGLAAVAATGLTRAEIFDSLYHRQTYGTTGAKILLQFSINGRPMGQKIAVHSSLKLWIEAHGTAEIEIVEVLRCVISEQRFKVLHTLRPGTLDFTWSAADELLAEDSIYYVRLRQVGLVRDRIAMAWSSPIWVKRESNEG
jgi:hypothetical protein